MGTDWDGVFQRRMYIGMYLGMLIFILGTNHLY